MVKYGSAHILFSVEAESSGTASISLLSHNWVSRSKVYGLTPRSRTVFFVPGILTSVGTSKTASAYLLLASISSGFIIQKGREDKASLSLDYS